MNQFKIYRCIKLMQLMEERPRQIATIERYLNVSNRTIYRYFSLFKSLGYQVNKDKYNNYYLKML